MTDALRCLVLGGTGYIGSAVVKTLLRAGALVAFSYHKNTALAHQLCEEIPHSRAISLSLSAAKDNHNVEAIDKVVRLARQELGGLDVLIYCIGTAGDELVYNAPEDEWIERITGNAWDAMMEINTKSAFFAAQSAVAMMSQKGHIIFVGATNGIKPLPAPAHYAASKGAMVAMTQSLAKSLGKRNILVNQVAVGLLEGGMGLTLNKDLICEYQKHSSMRRLGTSEEIADMVGWLVFENTYMTGQSIVLDGGL